MPRANPQQPTQKQSLRMQRAMLILSGVLLLLGLVQGAYFALRGVGFMVAVELVLVCIGASAGYLTWRGRMQSAALLLIGTMFLMACGISLVQDIPSAGAPRTTHYYLLVLAMAAFLMFREQSAWLRRGIALLCFAAFIALGASNWGLQTPYALPDDVRVAGSWVHSVIAVGLMFALLAVMQSELAAYNALAADLRTALSRNEFVLHYQPQLGASGEVLGAEALIRWQHPLNGLIPPDEFVTLAEQMGLILRIGHWVLGTACAQLLAWEKSPLTAGLSISVNVNAQQFKQSDYVSQVLSVLERTGADPTRLKLELTESMLVNDVEDIMAKMAQLRSHGIRLSLDDFGTGYSSLTYLKRLPLDQLKIDESFVHDVLANPRAAAIVRTVIELAQTMNLDVIAEGVETEQHREFLQGIGCRSFQGYLFSKALPIGGFDRFVANSSASTRLLSSLTPA